MIDVAPTVVTTVVAAVKAAAVATAAAGIVAAFSVHAIVALAQGIVCSHHGSSLQSIAVDATIVTDQCNFELYIRRLPTLQHTSGVPHHLDSTAHWRSYTNFGSKCMLEVFHMHELPCFDLRVVHNSS